MSTFNEEAQSLCSEQCDEGQTVKVDEGNWQDIHFRASADLEAGVSRLLRW